jgi:hypothetical protein
MIGIGPRNIHASRLAPWNRESDEMSQASSKMVSYEDYVAGWLDSSIHDFLELFAAAPKSMDYALMTCLDSNPDLASLLDASPEFRSLMANARPLGRGLLLPTKELLEAESSDRVFFGFDEVWFFPSEKIEPKPEAVGLVGPARVDQRTLNRLGAWMTGSSCSLGIGDGEGLNFIVKARGLVRYLLGHSNDQAAPALRNDYLFEEENTARGPAR